MPNGWFAVAWADDLKPGEVKPLRCLERDLVIFRGRDGSVGVLDAYCPHLGAHLGFGRVEGNRIICPFHHWEFDVTGVCLKIPHAQMIPKKAALRMWPVREANRVIQVYHHAAQHPAVNEPATFAPLEAKGWTVCGRDQYRLRSHPYDLAENGADEVHLRTVHGSAVVSARLVESESEFATYFELEPMLGRHRWPLRVALETHIRELGHMIITVHIGQRISFHIVQYIDSRGARPGGGPSSLSCEERPRFAGDSRTSGGTGRAQICACKLGPRQAHLEPQELQALARAERGRWDAWPFPTVGPPVLSGRRRNDRRQRARNIGAEFSHRLRGCCSSLGAAVCAAVGRVVNVG